MGLFSDKLTCANCGKSFNTMLNEYDGLCPKCAKKQQKIASNYLTDQGEFGFIPFFPIARGVRSSFNVEACKAQISHRNEILQSHCNNDLITIDEINYVNANFFNINDMQKEDVVRRIIHTTAWKIQDNYLCNGFLMNCGLYGGVTIDLSKVVLMAINPNISYGRGVMNYGRNNISVIGLVTNDPFISFYRIILGNEPRFFGGNYARTSNFNMNNISLLQSYCPNLRNDIINYTQLENVLSNGNYNDIKFNVQYMHEVHSFDSFDINEFEVINANAGVSAIATRLISQCGYIDEETINRVLAIKNGRSNSPLGNYILGIR